MNNCTIRELNWQAAQADSARIRTAVFMQEQHVSAADEWDGMDEQATHFLAHHINGDAIATGRILTENHNNHTRYHIGRVAVLKNYRNLGIGHQLMCAMITWCQHQTRSAEIYLHAQVTRQVFYQKLGFIAQGTEFMDAGIAHISMSYQQEFDNEHSLPTQ